MCVQSYFLLCDISHNGRLWELLREGCSLCTPLSLLALGPIRFNELSRILQRLLVS